MQNILKGKGLFEISFGNEFFKANFEFKRAFQRIGEGSVLLKTMASMQLKLSRSSSNINHI